jgi:hypothetical protein
MNFEEMGIPVGSTLHYTQGDQTVIVAGAKKVLLGEEEFSLTAATRMISQVEYDQPPALYWTFKGRLLREIYEERYELPQKDSGYSKRTELCRALWSGSAR